MKRFFSILLCAVLLICVCGCGAVEDPALPVLPPDAGNEEPSAQSAPAPTPEAEPEISEVPMEESLSAARYDGNYSGYERLVPAAARASSSLDYFGKIFYPEYAADGDINTCWQEAGKGNGVDEYIILEYAETVSASLIRFRLGYAKDDNGFYMNGRPSELLIDFSDGQSLSCAFPDDNGWYTVQLSESVELDWVSFTIEAVYGGDDYLDTCIAEICLYTESPGTPPETDYSGGLVPPDQPAAKPEDTAAADKEHYEAYIELLETGRWTTDFGINLEASSRLEGKTLREFWDMSWEEYIRQYPVNYAIVDFDHDGVDELMICGNCVIGLIEDCYFFDYVDSRVVYMGSVEMTPDAVFHNGDGFVLTYGITMFCAELEISFANGVPVEGGYTSYDYGEQPGPSDRGLALACVCHELNSGVEPYLDPLIALIG